MKVYTYINTNIDRIKSEIKIGLMPPSILRHWEIYSRFDYYRRAGNDVVSSVLYASSDMRTSERTIFRIVKQMEMDF